MEKNYLFEKEKKNSKKFFLLKRVLSLSKMKYLYINNKSDINNNKIKFRNPGIDFVRILSMYAIIIHHILLYGNLYKKYNKYKELYLMNISCFWHVSSYALISGYIGYKTNKYSNLLYLWISVLFYSLGITYIFGKYNIISSTEKIHFEDYFPFYFNKYWYFTKYFGMYLFYQ